MFVFRLRGCRDQGGLGMGGGGKRSVLSRALTFPHPPSTPSWASPETPLLTSLFAQLGLKHILVAHTFRTNIIPIYPSSPWCSFCAGSAACSPCLQSCRVLEPAWETWPWNTPFPRPASRTPGMGAGRCLQPGLDAERGFSVQGGTVRCDRAGFV